MSEWLLKLPTLEYKFNTKLLLTGTAVEKLTVKLAFNPVNTAALPEALSSTLSLLK